MVGLMSETSVDVDQLYKGLQRFFYQDKAVIRISEVSKIMRLCKLVNTAGRESENLRSDQSSQGPDHKNKGALEGFHCLIMMQSDLGF